MSSKEVNSQQTYLREFKFGNNYGSPALFRDLGDGEKTMGFLDLDGKYTNGEQSYIFAPEMTTMTTGCELVQNVPGIGTPGIRTCPIDVSSATFTVSFQEKPSGFKAGWNTEYEPVEDSQGPITFQGHELDFSGSHRTQFEADRTYTMKWNYNTPPGRTNLKGVVEFRHVKLTFKHKLINNFTQASRR